MEQTNQLQNIEDTMRIAQMHYGFYGRAEEIVEECVDEIVRVFNEHGKNISRDDFKKKRDFSNGIDVEIPYYNHQRLAGRIGYALRKGWIQRPY